MATFLGLKQIWVWVKKLPILFFVASFISFEPKLKMVAIAASISSTSLFFPTLSFGLKLTTLSFTSPPIPIPRESNRYETLHSSPTHRRQIEVAPPHTPSKVRRPPTLRRSSTLHYDTILTQLHPTLRSHTHLQHLRSVTDEAIYGFGF